MPEIKTCYYCGVKGDHHHIAHVHIGGRGDVEFPACDDIVACIKRVEHPILTSLDDLVLKLKAATDNLRRQIFPTKPDWMSQDKWLEIGGE